MIIQLYLSVMKNKLIFGSILIIIGCSAPKVVNFVNEDSRFANYYTFDITNSKNNSPDVSMEGRIFFDQIENNIANQMNRRTYKQSSSNPDLLIRYELIANQVTETERTNSYVGNGYFVPTINSQTITKAAILLELIDLSNRKMVWQASVDLSKYHRKSKKQSDIIKEAINHLYNTYLYKAGSKKIDETLKEVE